MSIATAFDVAYVKFRVADLDVMSRFYADFGLVEAARTEDQLFLRGHGPAPFAVHCKLDPSPGFAGMGVSLALEEGLAALSKASGAPIEALDAPGGGHCVRLLDPSGHQVEAVFGQLPVEPLAVPHYPAWNQGAAYPRQSRPRRVQSGASHVQRLGHVMLGAVNYAESRDWYMTMLGMIISDEIRAGPGIPIGAFLRADRGAAPCDHHTIALVERGPGADLMHYAFEVVDVDDLMAGGKCLEGRGWTRQWGVGRHILGSQVFDYWLDPLGYEIEHWTDGDQFVAADGGGVASVEELIGVQWGPDMPAPPQLS